MSKYKALRRIKFVIDKVVDITVIILFLVMVFFTFLQVVGRYVFATAPSWTEELARYISIWVVFLSAAIGFRTSSHLSVDFFVELLPKVPKKIIFLLINTLLIVMLLLFISKGFYMVNFVSKQAAPATRFSMGFVYAAIPVGTLLMALEVFISSIKIIHNP